MKDPRCTICHEKPLFPVRFQCFPCSFLQSSHDKRHCSTLTVVCMQCADRYLELDKRPSDRPLSKRCLFCAQTVDPLCLSKEIAYEILHPLMDIDDATYRCPHLACPFEGSHLDLFDHVSKECVYRTVSCRECFKTYQLVFEDMHKMTEPCHAQCTVCEHYVPTRKLKQHMEEDHAHFVQCMVCQTYIPEYDFNQHMREKHEGHECRYCGKWIWYMTTGEEGGLHEEFLRHINQDECEGSLECPMCVDGTMILKPKDILGHLGKHSDAVQMLLEKYEDLLDAYVDATLELVRDRDHVLHTEWIKKILVEKKQELRTVQTFIKKHERFWV